MDTRPMEDLFYWKRSLSEMEPGLRAIRSWKRGFRRRRSVESLNKEFTDTTSINHHHHHHHHHPRTGSGSTALENTDNDVNTTTPNETNQQEKTGYFYRKLWLKSIHIVWTLTSRLRRTQQRLFCDLTIRRQMENVKFSSSRSSTSEKYQIFDPSEFKANRQMRMSSETKKILTKPSEERTEQEIYYVTIALRGIRPISDYPIRMQQNLAKYGQFECYEGGRLVLKEGHPPLAFYFILYGAAMVAVFNAERGEAETKCILRRDDGFGELAIMNRSARQSTVITKSYTELLSIDLDIYEKIFMESGQSVQRNITDPDQQQFVENVSFLKGWPTDLLVTTKDPNLVVFAYFKRGIVMLKDSKDSDWLYVVKSGSVSVLKKLACCYCNRKSFLELGASSGLRTAINCQTNRTGNAGNQPGIGSPRSVIPSGSTSSRAKKFPIRTQSASFVKPFTLSGREKSSLATFSHQTHANDDVKRRPKTATVQKQLNRKDDVVEINDASDESHPHFIRIQILTKGNVFGLSYLIFQNQPSLSLVSNGAECIMINKQFYLDNCSKKCKDKLQIETSPFPPEETFQNGFEEKMNWILYKESIIQKLCQHNNN